MTELFDFRRRQVLRGAVTAGIAALLAGCTGILGGSGEQEHYEEPEEPPETVANGFDIDVAYETTVDAIHERPFELIGHVSRFTSGDAQELVRSDATVARGKVEDDVARAIDGSSSERALTDGPRAAEEVYDIFFRDGVLFNAIKTSKRPTTA